jgi:hypothetical protein
MGKASSTGDRAVQDGAGVLTTAFFKKLFHLLWVYVKIQQMNIFKSAQ